MEYKQNERNIIFVSELKHIDMLEHFLAEHPALREEGFLLIPWELETEYALKEKGIPFRSGGLYRIRDTTTIIPAEKWTTSIFESEHWSFFTYRGVSLSQLYFVPLMGYFSYVLYCAAIVVNVLAAHTGAKRLIVFASLQKEPAKGSTLIGPQLRVFRDVVECIAEQKGIESTVVTAPATTAPPPGSLAFAFNSALFGMGIRVLNFCVSFFRRPRRLRALASDYWKSIAPYADLLDSFEIVLVDRREAFKAGLANIWKFRMRFLHLGAFSPNRPSDEHREAHNRIQREYESLKKEGWPAGEFHGLSLQPLVSRALDVIVDEVFTKIFDDIDSTYALFERVRPQIVLLRATISKQTHFVILAQVARARGIPSLEVQHGLEYNGPGSYSRRHSAEYMGVYGPFTKDEMKETGDTRTTPVIIGSPRFDVYASVPEKNKRHPKTSGEKVTFLCIANAIETLEDSDAYVFEEYFSAIAFALKDIPNASITVKLRPGDNGRNAFAHAMIASALGDIPYTIVNNEPLSDLFLDADVVIAGYTTAALEAMQCGKPLVFLGISSIEKLFGLHHFTAYAKDNAMRLATTKEDLARITEELAANPASRAELAAHGVAFLKREYAFDGHASERMAELIRSLAGET